MQLKQRLDRTFIQRFLQEKRDVLNTAARSNATSIKKKHHDTGHS